MGIERLEETGAAVADRGQPRGKDGAALPEAQEQQAYRVTYQATVEAEYRASALDSLDASAVELRKAWEAHEARWPPPRDPAQPGPPGVSGAWHGDGDRYLEADTNAEVERGCDRIREVCENVVTPAMRAIEAEDPDRHLIALEYRLKGADRIKEKVADAVLYKGRASEEALATIKDAIRFTFCYSDERYTSGVPEDCRRLQDRGFEPVDMVNSWEAAEYKGINSRWREPESRMLFEVQFHTRASFEAKQLTHAAYERLRNPVTSDHERAELQAFQRHVSAEIPMPTGVTSIEEYSPERRDG